MTGPDAGELVILVGPDDDIGNAVCAALGGWARAEMVRPAYWVNPQPDSDGVIAAKRLDHQGVSPVQLPRDLGRTVWDGCTLVVVQPVSPTSAGTSELVAWASRYAGFLARSILPMDTALLRVNLLIPTSDATSIGQDLLADGFEETVIVSPEQRASTEHPNVLVLDDQDLISHSALAAASAAGMWQVMPRSPFNGLSAESASGEPNPRLMRSFVRTVSGGEVTEQIADRCLSPTDGRWRVPDSDHVQFGVAPDPAGFIEDMVDQLDVIDHGALMYGTPPPTVSPERVRVGWRVIWATFKEFWSLVLRRIGDIPGRMVAAAEQRISATIFGSEGAHEFGFGVDDVEARVAQVVQLRNDTGGDVDGSIFGHARLASRALALLGREMRPEAARAQAWVELRQLCLGVVDGGPMPADVDAPLAGAVRPVINNPSLVVPNSEAPRFEVPDDVTTADETLAQYKGVVLPPCDPLLTARLDRDLAAVRDGFAERQRQERDVAQRKQAEAATLLESAAASSETETRTALEAQAARADKDGAKAEDRADLLHTWVRRLTEVEADLTAWAQPRLNTLFWRVGETIGRNLDVAVIDQQRALEGVDAPAKLDVLALDRARKRVFWTVLLAGLVGLAAGLYGLLRFDVLWAPIVAGVVVVAVCLAAFISYARLKSETEWRFAKAAADHLNALNLLMHAAREVSRLSTLYQLFIEWAEILGYQAHIPWVKDDSVDEHPAPAPVDNATLPPALVLGTSEVGDENLALLGARAARDIQREGWLGDAFHEGRDFSMERLSYQEGRPVEDLDPDGDSPTNASGARAFLLDDLRAHRPQQHAYRTAMGTITEFCAGLEPKKLFQSVEVAGGARKDVNEFLAELVPKPGAAIPGFLVDLVSAEAKVKRMHEQVSPFVWAPIGIGHPGTVVHLPAVTTRSGEFLLQAVRIDTGPPMAPEGFALFDRGTRASEEPRAQDSGDW